MKISGNKILDSTVFLGVLISFILCGCEPEVSGSLKEKFDNTIGSDSVLQEKRYFGNITLHKFTGLLSRSGIYDTTANISRKADTIYFAVTNAQQMNMFLGYGDGSNEGEKWSKKYKNLPISIHADQTIAANVNVINGKEYVYLPYEMLFCVLDYVGKKTSPDGGKNTTPNYPTQRDSIVTIRSHKDIIRKSAGGSKIEVEGYVLKNVSDILSQGYSGSNDPVEQLKFLYKYVRANWIYIYDPNLSNDVWRSASETIENYYFSTNHKYTGDCDDFAILMASFARQVGLSSHFVVEWTEGKGGHAYAIYSSDRKKWYSLDWDNSAFKNIKSRHSNYSKSEILYDM